MADSNDPDDKDQRRIAPRLSVGNVPLTARIRLFGLLEEVTVGVANLSMTGLLLTGRDGQRYNPSSLLEVALDLPPEEAVALVARFVRHHDASSFALSIADYEETDMKRYEMLIRRIEEFNTDKEDDSEE